MKGPLVLVKGASIVGARGQCGYSKLACIECEWLACVATLQLRLRTLRLWKRSPLVSLHCSFRRERFLRLGRPGLEGPLGSFFSGSFHSFHNRTLERILLEGSVSCDHLTQGPQGPSDNGRVPVARTGGGRRVERATSLRAEQAYLAHKKTPTPVGPQ